MPAYRRIVRAFNPAEIYPDDSGVGLRSLRLSALIVGVVVVPFGWLFHATDATVYDPMLGRVVCAVVALLLLASTFVSAWVETHARRIDQVASLVLLAYFAVLTYANGLSASYAIGFLFVFVGLALEHGLTYACASGFAMYLSFMTIVAVALAVAVPEPSVPPLIFTACTVGLTGLLMLTVTARTSLSRALRRNESHLDEAQATAHMGSWELDFVTHQVLWSAGMYRLTGLPHTTAASAEAFVARVHPDDRDDLLKLDTLDPSDELEVRYRAATSVVWRHAKVRRTLSRHADGTPERVFGTVQDVTDLYEREETLRDALRRAEEGAHAKSEFLANMSHEIRTPLTAIIGFAQLLSEELDGTHTDLVSPIEVGGQRLLTTLNSVLDLARMEAGQGDLQVTAVDVGAEMEAIARMLAAQGAARGIEVQAVRPHPPLIIAADPAALTRVLTNLASNAVKFTDHGAVTLSAHAEGDHAIISVTDTGRGMDADFLGELFEPFRQASSGWSRSHEGTGLGLTIVKRLVEDMHGTVAVESTVGQGTTFVVRLPLAVPEAVLSEPEPVAG